MENIENVKEAVQETGEVIKETSNIAQEAVEKAVNSGFNGWAVAAGAAVTGLAIAAVVVTVKCTKNAIDKHKAKKEAKPENPEVVDPKPEN